MMNICTAKEDRRRMRSVVVGDSGEFSIEHVDEPLPGPNEVLVRVSALSVNRCDIHISHKRGYGYRPGWNLAGVVVSEQLTDLALQPENKLLGY
jgi:NADPH:quinone reductase-like Zn-dependent oxidoreductase